MVKIGLFSTLKKVYGLVRINITKFFLPLEYVKNGQIKNIQLYTI